MTSKEFNRLAKAIGIVLALIGIPFGVVTLFWCAPMITMPITTGVAIVWLVYLIYDDLKQEGE